MTNTLTLCITQRTLLPAFPSSMSAQLSSDAGTRLLFKFRSGTHRLNEELGRHRGREGRKECALCDAECESVSHVLWDCPAYASIRSAFMLELRRG